jgi:hypothetical protein
MKGYTDLEHLYIRQCAVKSLIQVKDCASFTFQIKFVALEME